MLPLCDRQAPTENPVGTIYFYIDHLARAERKEDGHTHTVLFLTESNWEICIPDQYSVLSCVCILYILSLLLFFSFWAGSDLPVSRPAGFSPFIFLTQLESICGKNVGDIYLLPPSLLSRDPPLLCAMSFSNIQIKTWNRTWKDIKNKRRWTGKESSRSLLMAVLIYQPAFDLI